MQASPAPRVSPLRVWELAARANMLLPGLYAWILTVAIPAFGHNAPSGARVTALGAPVALLTGVALAPSYPRWGRAFGVVGFVGLSLAAWVLLGSAVGTQRLEPVVSALGCLGWLLFSLGCGSIRPLDRLPEEDPRVLSQVPLPAHGALPRGATWVLFAATLGGLLVLGLAWMTRRPAHALLAHAAALLATVAIISVGARVATERGGAPGVLGSLPRIRLAAGPLMTLCGLVLMGALWAFLR
jgi:hypothetical protein